MDCNEIRPLLDNFAEGELQSPHKEIVEEHLKACPLCRKELSSIRHILRLLRDSREVEEPPDFLQQVRQRIQRRQQRRFLRRLLGWPAPARVLVPVGCVMLAAFGIWLLYKQFTPPSERTVSYPTEEHGKRRVLARTHTAKGTAGYPTEKIEKPMEIALVDNHLRELVPETTAKFGVTAPKDADGDGIELSAATENAEKSHPIQVARLSDEEALASRLGTRGRGAAGPGATKGTHRKTLSATPDAPTAGLQPLVEKRMVQTETTGALATDNYLEGAKAGRAEPEEPVRGQLRPALDDADPPLSDSRVDLMRAYAKKEARSAGEELEGIPGRPEEPAKTHLQTVLAARGVTTDADEGLRHTWHFDRQRDELFMYLGKQGAQKTPETENGKEEAPPEAGGNQRAVRSRSSRLALQEPQEGIAQVQSLSFLGMWGEALNVNGNLVGVTGGAKGAIPELVVIVKDRKKAHAQLKQIVADLGGTIEAAISQHDKDALGYSTFTEAYGDALVVKLKPDAYGRLLGRFSVPLRGKQGGLAGRKPQSGETAEETQTMPQRQGPMTFRIRLIEVSDQNQPQQLPSK